MDDAQLVEDAVHRRYAELAVIATEGGVACCGEEGEACFGPSGYAQAELDQLPELAANASLGCGNPTAVTELSAGEIVLDLGSGGGIDVILSARRVGPGGKAYGLDMTN
ncbi:MAG: arsenite S-adenosylmethyltransferase, partial [Actinobacteria bacterium]|nr:arsenite S-adenosylmethyltransferase [Actinomycetota bacterium]